MIRRGDNDPCIYAHCNTLNCDCGSGKLPLPESFIRLCGKKNGSKSIISSGKLHLNVVISHETHKMVVNKLDNALKMIYTLPY